MSLQPRIIALMDDGRERTINDVALRLVADKAEVKRQLTNLVRCRRLTMDDRSITMVQIYRKAGAV